MLPRATVCSDTVVRAPAKAPMLSQPMILSFCPILRVRVQ